MGLLSAFMGGALGQGLVDTAARMGRREEAAGTARPAWDENLGDQALREQLGRLIRPPGQGSGSGRGAGDGSGRAGRIGVDEQPVSAAVRVLADGLVRRGQGGPQAAPDPGDPRDPSGDATATVPGPPDEARFRTSVKAYGAALQRGGQPPGQSPAPIPAGNAGGAPFAPPIAAHVDRARADARQLLGETRDPARMKAIRDTFSAYSGQAY